eukprot:SAG31_NODE_86_length_26973_cov_16.850897_2_plen_151_part_00
MSEFGRSILVAAIKLGVPQVTVGNRGLVVIDHNAGYFAAGSSEQIILAVRAAANVLRFRCKIVEHPTPLEVQKFKRGEGPEISPDIELVCQCRFYNAAKGATNQKSRGAAIKLPRFKPTGMTDAMIEKAEKHRILYVFTFAFCITAACRS